MEEKEAWDLLRQELPERHQALKALSKSVYGVEGLTDVAEWHLWERLEQSGLPWELKMHDVLYIGTEERKVRNTDYTQTWYLVSITGTLTIGEKIFPCVGASENRKLDAAYKGALTSMFKNGCKWAGLTMWLYKGGKIVDSLDDVTPAATETPSTPTRLPVQSQTASQVDVINRAVQELDGKVVKGEEVLKSVSLTDASPEQDELMQRRIKLLEEFNTALPNPNAEPWVRSTVALFNVRREEGHLTEDMARRKTPINYAWTLLLTMHENQCKPVCDHARPFLERLKAIT